MSDPNQLLRLVTRTEYRSGREHVFPSDTSIEWFIRCNRAVLVAKQALLKPAGRTLIHADRFDAVVLEVGHAAMEAA